MICQYALCPFAERISGKKRKGRKDQKKKRKKRNEKGQEKKKRNKREKISDEDKTKVIKEEEKG